MRQAHAAAARGRGLPDGPPAPVVLSTTPRELLDGRRSRKGATRRLLTACVRARAQESTAGAGCIAMKRANQAVSPLLAPPPSHACPRALPLLIC